MTIKKSDKLVEIYNRFGGINRPTEEIVFKIIELEQEYKIKTTNLTYQEQEILEEQNKLKSSEKFTLIILSKKIGINVRLLEEKISVIVAKLLIVYLKTYQN